MANKINYALVIIFFCIGLFLLLTNNYNFNIYTYFYLFSIYITTSFIIINFIIKVDKFNNLPLFELTNLYFLACYISLFFFNKNTILYGNNYNIINISYAIKILFFGFFSYFISYFITLKLLNKVKRNEITFFNCQLTEIYRIGLILSILVIFVYNIFELQNKISGLSQLRYPLLLFGIFLLFFFVIKGSSEKYFILKSIVALILIALPLISEILKGLYTFPFIIIFLLYVFYIYNSKKINILPFLAISILFLLFNYGKTEYRKVTWNQNGSEYNQIQKIKIFFNLYKQVIIADIKSKQLFKEDVKDKQDFSGTRDYSRIVKRINHSIDSLIIVTTDTPKKISYWGGYSYKILASKFIPRIFWENKPSDSLGNEFGHRYNILTKQSLYNETLHDISLRDNSTSWNMPVLNEFYVNFGFTGVVVGMFFLGCFFASITKLFSIFVQSNLERVISFIIFLPLFFLETHLSITFGAVIQSYIFLIIVSIILLKFLRKSFFNK